MTSSSQSRRALRSGGDTVPEEAHMIENAFEVAKRLDNDKGLEIVTEGMGA
jgi:hypothetical protein